MLKNLLFPSLCLLVVIALPGEAAIRGPGFYHGVVVFDRWGGCTFNSGQERLRVSPDVSEGLRPYTGECVKLEVIKLPATGQFDYSIEGYGTIESVPFGYSEKDARGFDIYVEPAFVDGQLPELKIRVKRLGYEHRRLTLEQLAPKLMARPLGSTQWDRRSEPTSAGQGVWSRLVGISRGEPRGDHRWKITAPARLPEALPHSPGEQFEFRILFDIPPGQYDFFVAYGNGGYQHPSIASNLIAFDVLEDGTAEYVIRKQP